MGSKRVGLARTQALIENLKRELSLQNTTLNGAGTDGQMTKIADAHGAGAQSTRSDGVRHYRYRTPDGTFVNTIELDLTGLKSYNDVGDVIGVEGESGPVANAFITKYVASTFGILFKVEVSCIETPTAVGNPCLDFDLISATNATLAGDGDVAGEGDAVAVFTAGATFAKGTTIQNLIPGQPGADGDAIYLATGALHTGNGVHTAGKLLINFFGSPDF